MLPPRISLRFSLSRDLKSEIDQVFLEVKLLQIDEGRPVVTRLGQQIEFEHLAFVKIDLADVPDDAFLDHRVATTEPVENFERPLGEADRSGTGAHLVAFVENDDWNAVLCEIDRGTGRSAPRRRRQPGVARAGPNPDPAIVDRDRAASRKSRSSLSLQGGPHREIALGGPDARRVVAQGLVISARDVEGEAMFVDRVRIEFRIARGVAGVPGLFQRAAAARNTRDWAIGRCDEIERVVERLANPRLADQRAATAGRDRIDAEGPDRFQRGGSVREMPVAAIASRVKLDDVAGEHHVGVRHEGDYVAGRMRAAEELQIDAALAEIKGRALVKRQRRPGQSWNALVALEQAREALELGVPVFLAALDHHRARLVGHYDFRGAIG